MRAVSEWRWTGFCLAAPLAVALLAGCEGVTRPVRGPAGQSPAAQAPGAAPPSAPAAQPTAPPAGGAASSEGGSGAVTVKGSDTMLPLAQKWAEELGRKKPEVQVTVTGGGSGAGISALIDRTADIANSSRRIKDDELAAAKRKGADIKEWEVAHDAIAIVVHPSNPVKSLTKDQVRDIYTGAVSSWSRVGGPDRRISAVGRDAASGTYDLFRESALGKQAYRTDMASLPSNDQVASTVEKNPAAIGYVGIAFARKSANRLKTVPISAGPGQAPVLPSDKTVQDKTYPFSRPLYCYTWTVPTGTVKAYLDFVYSPAGQKIVSQVGYVPWKAPK